MLIKVIAHLLKLSQDMKKKNITQCVHHTNIRMSLGLGITHILFYFYRNQITHIKLITQEYKSNLV